MGAEACWTVSDAKTISYNAMESFSEAKVKIQGRAAPPCSWAGRLGSREMRLEVDRDVLSFLGLGSCNRSRSMHNLHLGTIAALSQSAT